MKKRVQINQTTTYQGKREEPMKIFDVGGVSIRANIKPNDAQAHAIKRAIKSGVYAGSIKLDDVRLKWIA